jgi:uncharacterized cupredoxin-like copper-binding protein
MRSMRLFVISLALVSLVACQRETPDVSQNTPSQSTTMSQTETAAVATSELNPPIVAESDNPAATPTAASPTQEVHLIEYEIHMPDTLPAGRVAFNVENGGKENHAFEIEGNGIEQKTDVLTRGNTTALEVELKPGTYTVYCPVPGHAEKGMKKTVTVR